MSTQNRIESAIISNYQISDALQQNTNLGFNVTSPIVTAAPSNSNLFSSNRNSFDMTDIFTSFSGGGAKDSTPVYGPMTKEDYDKSQNKANGNILSSFLGLFKGNDPSTPTPPYTAGNAPKTTPVGYYLVGAIILYKLFKRK